MMYQVVTAPTAAKQLIFGGYADYAEANNCAKRASINLAVDVQVVKLWEHSTVYATYRGGKVID